MGLTLHGGSPLSHRIASVVLFAVFGLAGLWPDLVRGQPASLANSPPVDYGGLPPERAWPLAGAGRRAGAVAFNRDGSILFVAHDDGSIRQYDAKYGVQVERTIETGPAPIHALAVSLGSQWFAAAAPSQDPKTLGDQVTIRRFSGTEVVKLSRMPGQVIALSFSSDEIHIGAIDHLYNVRVWRLKDGGEEFTSEVHRANGRRPESAATRANFSADLNRALIVNDADDVLFKEGPWNHVVRLWEVGGKEPRLFGERLGLPVGCAAVSPDGSRIVAVQEDYCALIKDFSSGKLIRCTFPQIAPNVVWETRRPTFVMISPDNRRLVSGTKTGVVHVEFVDSTPNPHHAFAWPSRHVRTAAFLPNGARFASGGWEQLGNEKIAGTDLPKYEPVTVWEVEVIEGK